MVNSLRILIKEEEKMAKKVTAKKPLSGNNRSHALNATKRTQKPNLQTVTVDGIKVRLTAREAKTIKKDTTKKEN